jgi:Regulator of chromosome condensation (RCC1) repeat
LHGHTSICREAPLALQGTDYGLAPIDIPGLNRGVLAISARGSIGCAITTAREVKCWGAHYGSTPDTVPGLSEVNALTTGFPLCALTGSGGVKCWGSDSGWTPVDVLELTSGVRAIDTSAGHGCALMKTGGVKCWGSNDHGQLGDGTTADRAMPVDVAGLRSGATGIATGFVHSCAVLGSGGIKCWGANGSGQLGDRTPALGRRRPGASSPT